MSKNKLNISIALKIINHFNDILQKATTNLYHKYGYSDLEFYDVIDLSKAYSLVTAYMAWTAKDAKNLQEINEYAMAADSALIGFPLYFVPDAEKAIFDNLDRSDPDFRWNWMEVQSKSDFQHSEAWASSNIELTTSFLKFCLEVRNDANYWTLVFERLDIEYDTSNKRDKIFDEIMSVTEKTKANIQNTIVNSDAEVASIESEISVSPARKTRNYIINFIYNCLLIISLFYVGLRHYVVVFTIVLTAFYFVSAVIFYINERRFGNILYIVNMLKNAVLCIALFVGLSDPSVASYVIICVLALNFSDFVRELATKQGK